MVEYTLFSYPHALNGIFMLWYVSIQKLWIGIWWCEWVVWTTHHIREPCKCVIEPLSYLREEVIFRRGAWWGLGEGDRNRREWIEVWGSEEVEGGDSILFRISFITLAAAQDSLKYWWECYYSYHCCYVKLLPSCCCCLTVFVDCCCPVFLLLRILVVQFIAHWCAAAAFYVYRCCCPVFLLLCSIVHASLDIALTVMGTCCPVYCPVYCYDYLLSSLLPCFPVYIQIDVLLLHFICTTAAAQFSCCYVLLYMHPWLDAVCDLHFD